MLRKLLLYSLLALGGLFLPSITVFATSYTDLPTAHWAWPHIQRLAAIGVLEPFNGTEFAGEEPLTRFEYIQSLNPLLDYINANSGRSFAMVQVEDYFMDQGEKISELEESLSSLEARLGLQNILLTKLEREIGHLELGQSELPGATQANPTEAAQYSQRITSLEESVSQLEQDLQQKNEQISRLYIVLALLGAASILK